MIEVFANGRKFSEWTEARVTRSIDHIAASFSLSLVAKNSDGDPVRLFPGDAVEVSVNGTTVISGYVDRLSTSFSAGQHSVSVSGSECSVDIADCCVAKPLEWANKRMDEIIRDVCDVFGLSFSNRMSVDVGKPFKKFSVDIGSKAIDTISKVCKERGILCCSDGMGKVYLLKPSSCPRGPALRQGENLLAATVDFSLVNRYSTYTVYGTGKAKSKAVGKSVDSDVSRNRPLIVIDVNSVEKDKVQARADWENRIRKAKSMGFKATVHGWEHDGGLWTPGVICSFEAPNLYVEEPLDLLVSAVEFSWGSQGEITTMTLVPPESFDPKPEFKKVTVSPWDSVARDVRKK